MEPSHTAAKPTCTTASRATTMPQRSSVDNRSMTMPSRTLLV